jgi:hypothetical protein
MGKSVSGRRKGASPTPDPHSLMAPSIRGCDAQQEASHAHTLIPILECAFVRTRALHEQLEAELGLAPAIGARACAPLRLVALHGVPAALCLPAAFDSCQCYHDAPLSLLV